MDRLEAIIEKQRKLQERVDKRYTSEDPAVRAAFMRDHRGYLADELAEALYEMPNYKQWKDYSDMSPEKREVQWQKVRMELIDCLHFFVNLLIGAGMNAEEIYQMYMAKNDENHRRQDAGYTSDVSYREQAVEEVMDNHCVVYHGGTSLSSDRFITLLTNNNSECNLIMNTDTITLGMLAHVLYDAYQADLRDVPEREATGIMQEVANAVINYREATHE